jgi:hypothetical protein
VARAFSVAEKAVVEFRSWPLRRLIASHGCCELYTAAQTFFSAWIAAL